MIFESAETGFDINSKIFFNISHPPHYKMTAIVRLYMRESRIVNYILWILHRCGGPFLIAGTVSVRRPRGIRRRAVYGGEKIRKRAISTAPGRPRRYRKSEGAGTAAAAAFRCHDDRPGTLARVRPHSRASQSIRVATPRECNRTVRRRCADTPWARCVINYYYYSFARVVVCLNSIVRRLFKSERLWNESVANTRLLKGERRDRRDGKMRGARSHPLPVEILVVRSHPDNILLFFAIIISAVGWVCVCVWWGGEGVIDVKYRKSEHFLYL